MTTKLREQVREFHAAFDVPEMLWPVVPSDDRVRLRLRLIAEEFFELLEASIDAKLNATQAHIISLINSAPVTVDLPEFADACGDLDYVVEGSRLEFGIDGGPIADAIHESNMAKAGGPVIEGKIRKPEGWLPPDVDGELRKQGWEG
jgi:predicted HAD superfamily Cof-like phosphohydrolase